MTGSPSARNCPDCGQPLEFVRDDGGREYLGCSDRPECRYREAMPEDALMRRRGAPTLPGFGPESQIEGLPLV